MRVCHIIIAMDYFYFLRKRWSPNVDVIAKLMYSLLRSESKILIHWANTVTIPVSNIHILCNILCEVNSNETNK